MDANQHNKIEKFETAVEPVSNVNHKTRRAFWQAHPEMLKFKTLYFLQSGGLAAILPYLPFIARSEIGISVTAFSTAIMLQKFLSFLIKPALGYVADYFSKIKLMIIALTVIQTVCLILIVAVPKIQKSSVPEERFIFQSFKGCHLCYHSDNGFSETATSKTAYLISEAKSNLSLEDLCYIIDEVSLNISYEAAVEKWWKVLALNPNPNSEKNVSDYPMNFSAQVPVSCHGVPYSYCSSCVEDCGVCCSNDSVCHLDDIQSPVAEDISDFETYQFYIFALLFISGISASDSVATLSDTACLESAQKCGADLGRQMLWGSIGFGVVALPVGFLVDYTGSYLVNYFFMAFMCGIILCNIAVIEFVKPPTSANILTDFKTAMKSEDFAVFLIGALLNGIAHGHLIFHLLWFAKSIGGNGLLIGLIQIIGMLGSKVPFLFVSGWIIQKIGYFHVTSLSLLLYSFRLVLYSYTYNPYLILPTEWTYGFNTGVYLHAAASYAKLCSKPGTEALMQQVVSSTFMCLGIGIGSILTGVGFDYYGAHQTYFVSGIIFGGLAIISYCYILSRNYRKQTKELQLPP